MLRKVTGTVAIESRQAHQTLKSFECSPPGKMSVNKEGHAGKRLPGLQGGVVPTLGSPSSPTASSTAIPRGRTAALHVRVDEQGSLLTDRRGRGDPMKADAREAVQPFGRQKKRRRYHGGEERRV